MEAALESNKPEGPKPWAYIATLLELGILACLAANHSIVGGLLCAFYYYFSATSFLVSWLFRGRGR